VENQYCGTRYYLRGRSSQGCWSDARTISYTISQTTVYYADADGDGFGNASATTSACSLPTGYVTNDDDYDDTTALITNIIPQTYYIDTDGDGFGTTASTVYTSIVPLGYASNSNDQCPNSPGINNGCSYTAASFSNENYVHTKAYQVAVTDPIQIKDNSEVIESVAYLDGLGRPMQNIALRASGTGTPSSAVLSNIPEWDMDWISGSGGTPFFNRIGSDLENNRITGPNPFGKASLIWECGNDIASDADGGWNTDYVAVDINTTYRYSVWVKRTHSQNGTTYHGTQNVNNLDGSANSNPYFWYGDLPEINKWYLLVGVIHPHNYTGGDTGVSGVYDTQGNRIIDGKEYTWRSNTTTARFRSYLYYATDTNVRQYFYGPTLQKVNGSEASISTFVSDQKLKDIVTHVAYDDYGRQTKQYMPYSSTTNTYGSFKTGDQALVTKGFYNQKYAEDFPGLSVANTNAYSESLLEASPLNRPLKQAAPGKDWRMGSGHEISFAYKNNASTEVRLYEVSFVNNNTEAPQLISNGHYAPGELTRTITYDENHTTGKDHSTEEFTNKNGQVVLKRTYNNETAHDTYYVYDDFGNLTYVLPPKVTTSNGVSTTELSELCYQYKYDYRNRLIEKKIPGKGWEYIVYNKLDQPILTQDPNLKSQGKWLYTKYDAFGRVAYTGMTNTVANRATLQNSANNANDQYVARTSTSVSLHGTDLYYNNIGYPTSLADIHTVNYYDNDTFNKDGLSVPSSVYGQATINQTQGLATGSTVKILGTNKWITTITGYDYKRRPIYIASKNQELGTTDIVESKLDFVGKVLETKTTHIKGSNSPIVVIERFEYDHVARLIRQTHQIGNGPEELIVENVYDEIGQMTQKKVGNVASSTTRLQNVDYSYNVRGWLKDINDVNTIGNDLFSFSIKYNDPTSGTALYNGNISQTSWKTANQDDALNRIKAATGSNTSNYNVSNIAYDKMGNIQSLTRNGFQDNGVFTNMDVLDYDYDAGNKLTKVTDTGNATHGFKDGNTSGDDYSYDENGNLEIDKNKSITGITYNHLNLPTEVVFDNNPNKA